MSTQKSFADLLKTSPNRSHSLTDIHEQHIKKALSNLSINDTSSEESKADSLLDDFKRQRSKSIVLGMPSIWSDKNRTTPTRRHSVQPPPLNGYSSLLNSVQMELTPVDHIGKGKSLQDLNDTDILYVVEFKGGRSDLFFYNGPPLDANVLVIVEADRGKDLGKIVQNTMTVTQLRQLPADHELLSGCHMVHNELHPRQIYRLAHPSEVTMLIPKSEEEQIALEYCIKLAKEKALPMTVVDCEFQWDRRKLTFFFVADRRIDFRELVRDLFKVYKTRIWMMAVKN